MLEIFYRGELFGDERFLTSSILSELDILYISIGSY